MKVLSVVTGGSLVLVRNVHVNLEAASAIKRWLECPSWLVFMGWWLFAVRILCFGVLL